MSCLRTLPKQTRGVVGLRPFRKQLKQIFGFVYNLEAWENSRHFATPPLISFCFNQSDLGSDASSVWNFYAHPSVFISQGNQFWRREMSAVVSSYTIAHSFSEWQQYERKRLRSGPSRSHTLNMIPERLSERFWFATFHVQSSLLNIHFRLSGLQSSILFIYFRYVLNNKSNCD